MYQFERSCPKKGRSGDKALNPPSLLNPPPSILGFWNNFRASNIVINNRQLHCFRPYYFTRFERLSYPLFFLKKLLSFGCFIFLFGFGKLSFGAFAFAFFFFAGGCTAGASALRLIEGPNKRSLFASKWTSFIALDLISCNSYILAWRLSISFPTSAFLCIPVNIFLI